MENKHGVLEILLFDSPRVLVKKIKSKKHTRFCISNLKEHHVEQHTKVMAQPKCSGWELKVPLYEGVGTPAKLDRSLAKKRAEIVYGF